MTHTGYESCFDATRVSRESVIFVIITSRILPYNDTVIDTNHMDMLYLDDGIFASSVIKHDI